MSIFTINVRPAHALVRSLPGTPSTVLQPGVHRRRFRALDRIVDLREQLTVLSPQEMPTLEGLSVRATAAITWRVGDPVAFLDVADDPIGAIYLAAQVGLRDIVVDVPAEDAAAALRAPTAAATVQGAVAAAGERVGITVVSVVIKDVILPVEVRSAVAELVTAKARARVRLEAARAETAAIRSLANAAKVMEQYPALAQLQMMQALPSGATVKITAG